MISVIVTSLEPMMIMSSIYIRMYMMLEVLVYTKSDKICLTAKKPELY